jgi:exonuclease SbcC
MLIKSVELKNIKSYNKDTIEFSEGINGICGENGHGKTTILEAIGYVLFDFLPYNQADFLRHGEKSGYAAVTVEGNDEIEYTLHRKIGSGSDYFIRTPIGEIKGKKDVMAWIAGNLFHSVRSEDELPSLFENAIGVPQGTFTTAFLEVARNRKIIFDNILKVEEYKIAYDNLLPVINAIKKTIEEMERELIPLQTRTEKYPELKKEKDSLQVEIDEMKAEIQKLNIRISSLTKKKQELTEKKAQLDTLNLYISSERVHLDGLAQQLEKACSDLIGAESARKIADKLAPVEENFKKENTKLKKLEKARVERDKLKDEIAKIELKISGLTEKLERSKKLSAENAELEERRKLLIPKIEAACKLEESIQMLQKELRDPMADIILERFPALKEKETRAKKLQDEISRLTSKKNHLLPAVEKQKALDDEIKVLSTLHESLTKLGFELKRAVEREERARILSGEIAELETNIDSLSPLIEKQTALETAQQELNRQHAAVKSLLKQTKNNMKLAGTKGMCPIFNRVKCTSVSDFTKYFNDEINSRNRELEEIERQLKLNTDELTRLNNPQKQLEEKLVLIASRKKDLDAYKGVQNELIACNAKLEALASSYPLNAESNTVESNLKAVISEIKSKEKSLKELNDPAHEVDKIESLIASRMVDIDSLKDVPNLIETCLKQLEELNERFHLKDALTGNKYELELADELIENKKRALKALESPDKEDEVLNENIKKNLKELKPLEKVPEFLDSSKGEYDGLMSRLSNFEGLDEKIASVQEVITQLEPEHNKYLQALPLALKVDEYTQETKKIDESIALVKASLNEYTRKQEVLLKEFNESDLNDTISQLDDIGKIASGTTEAIKQKNKNLQKLIRELANMESELLKIKEIEKKLEKEKEFLSFSNFIRDTIKSSSEFVINEFIGEISSEANNIYCEIMDDYSANLKWTNDYDIEIESGGETSSFRQLSGGERMSAALAVRLALLKTLSSCDFVFLDEPTQNMDEIRRENLSEQIMNIKGFKQIFVISHDDTFNEKYGHVVKIEKINGESRVVT